MGEPGEAKVALVTGANKGIGLATARGLGRRGAVVLVGARREPLGEAAVRRLRAGGADTRALALDTTDDASVNQAAELIDKLFGRLDILVNNAAIKLETTPSPPSTCSLEKVRATLETNVLGTIRVILAMLPLLRRSASPRIVNVSSGMGSLTLATTEGTPYIDKPLLSYNVSKAALNAVTVQFANELRGTAFKVNAADPGYADTDMTRGPGARPTSRTAEAGARVVIRLATLDQDGPTGCFFDEQGPLPW